MSTRAEGTRLEVALRGGRAVVRATGGVLRVVTLSSQGPAVRLALVPERALLLAGDQVELVVTVDEGVHLHLVETAGTVAYDMRGGDASWRVRFAVGDGASLVHEALPWVSAAGSRVDRSLDLDLAGSGVALLRETLVLGRHGEMPGVLRSRTSVHRDAGPVLVEELDALDLSPARVLDAVYAFGIPNDPVPGVTRLVTADGDVVNRCLAGAAHEASGAIDRAYEQASSAVLRRVSRSSSYG